MAHRTNTRLEEDLQACIDHRVPIVITSLGAREEVNEAIHSYGGIVLHDVINDRFARKAIEKGADGLVAVAAGAGGHAGTTSPFALLPEIRAWFDGPVLLSGAIAHGSSVLRGLHGRQCALVVLEHGGPTYARVTCARMASFLAFDDVARQALAGDQFFVDLDISRSNLPTGARLAIREGTVIEVTTKPHNGCAKFRERFGQDALDFVNSEVGQSLRLRGFNARVVSGGAVRPGEKGEPPVS